MRVLYRAWWDRKMLVRIRPEDAEIGMFIHAFDGSWFDHPFWRRHFFCVETAEQLRRIQLADIDALVIDGGRNPTPPNSPSMRRSKPFGGGGRLAGACLARFAGPG